MKTERQLRNLLAKELRKSDPMPKGKDGAVRFLRSEEPLNEFYTGVINAMRACEPSN